MKKLLSLLSVLTISGTAVPITVAASPYQKEKIKLESNKIKYLKANNLLRNKRDINNNIKLLKTINNINANIDEAVFLNNKLYFGSNDGGVYEYNPETKEQKIVISTNSSFLFGGFLLNNKIYFGLADGKVYEYNPETKEQKIVIDIINGFETSILASNNKLYFISYDNNMRNNYNVYEYNPETEEQKIVIRTKTNNLILTSGVFLNNKLYFISYNNNIWEYDFEKEIKYSFFISHDDHFSTKPIVLNNKLYFYSDNNNLYEYDPITKGRNTIINSNDILYNSGVILKNKIYFFSYSKKIYEYDTITKKNNIVNLEIQNNDNILKPGVVLNNKLYFYSDNNNLYEYDPVIKKQSLINLNIKVIENEYLSSVAYFNNRAYFCFYNKKNFNYKIYEFGNALKFEFIESNIINLQEQIRRGLYLYYQEQNPNSYVKNIEFNISDLKYSDIKLIKEEELSMQKTTEDICVGETEFENSLSTEQKFKAQSCKYTRQKINSIQVIKGINKRIDNTLESGEISTDTTSTSNTKNTTTSLNAGAEVSAGWGPFSASVSTYVGSEKSNTYQRENSESKTKNISKIISNSASFDLSNLKEEQEIITNELEYPSQEITVAGNQSIKVIFNLNKIIKKYKVTFKQNIDGKIKAKIKNENDEIIEQEFSIKDIMLSLKENNLLPKEIIIDNNSVSFIGELIVSKNSSNLKVKTEEIDTI